MDIFYFLDGDPQRTGRIVDLGWLPWWTYEWIHVAFWRPLASLTHWLDYHLWPDRPALMHAQSILWFGALVGAVTLLYRRFMGLTWIAGLAALLYAIDDAHGMPVGFLANRNALLAALCGALAILAHDRWRRERWHAGAVLGPLLLAASLLAAEAGITTCAYLAAHALFADRASWSQRCRALVPYAAVVLVWRFLWTHLGYGVSEMGLYVEPVGEPVRFARAVLNRAPVLLLGQWALPPADTRMMLGAEGARCIWIVALAFVALLAVALVPLVRRDRLARFWTAGMLLSVVPSCATFPSDRLLLFVGIGAMALLAQLLAAVFEEPVRQARSRVRRIVAACFAAVFVLIHLIVAPIGLLLRASYPAGPKAHLEQLLIPAPKDRSVEKQDLVIVNPPLALVLHHLPAAWDLNGQPVPRRLRVLAPGLGPLAIRRPDARTLVVRREEGFPTSYLDGLFRSERHPMSPGQRVELTGMTVEVLAVTDDGRPAEAAFRFAVPLDDPSLRWLQWKNGAFVPFTSPPIGESVELTPGELAGWW